MKRRIDWTESARRDLQRIRDWIARDSRLYARRMVQRIRQRIEGCRVFPEAAPMVIEWNREDVRETYEGPYRIIFQIEETRLVVLAIIHAARLLSGLVNEEDGENGDENGAAH